MQNKFLPALALMFVTTSVLAFQADYNLPVTIVSHDFNASKENVLSYRNNVVVTQGTMQLKADQLDVDATAGKGKEVYIATGSPVIFSQALPSGQLLTAKASKMQYELSTRTLVLTGDAELARDGSLVQASTIRYNIEKQELSAQGNGSKQITTIFQPEETKNP